MLGGPYPLSNSQKFYRKNYAYWTTLMENILSYKNFWGLVMAQKQNPPQISMSWKNLNKEIEKSLALPMQEPMINLLTNINVANVAWYKKRNIFFTKNGSRVLYLKNMLYATKMEESSIIEGLFKKI